jgi:hypothetical protein
MSALLFLRNEVMQGKLGFVESVRLEPTANQLAINFQPCEIKPRADVLQQIRNFGKRAPFAVRRKVLGAL